MTRRYACTAISALTAAALMYGSAAFADDGGTSAAGSANFETVTILGQTDKHSDIGGSAYFIGPEALKKFRYSDVLRILRKAPGVYIQEEDGFGLRPNIGLRGSGLDRSARIALLEDGVLIAPAPYAAPAAYYFPTARRMNAIEVLKGPSSIAVGPRTTGGAVNFLSTPIPGTNRGAIDSFAGDDGLFDAHAWYGDSTDRFGWMAETVQQFHDGFKDLDTNDVNMDTGYDIDDYLVKFRVNSDPAAAFQQGLAVKLGYTDQVSNETYLGLTDDDFRATPFRRYAGSQRDKFTSEHEQYQATYFLRPASGNWDLSLTAYRNEFARNWYKVQSVQGASISNVLDDPMTYASELDYLRGVDSPDDAITLRNNIREYYSQGIQGDVHFSFALGATDIGFTSGFRIHRDEEDRFQDEDGYRMEGGNLVLTSDGAPGSQSNRVSDAEAWSLFTAIDIATGNWVVTPGLRFEDITLERRDYDTADPKRIQGPTQVRVNHASELIPGISAVYRISPAWRLLGGIHKGFNSPAPGSESNSEQSINYELGTRFQNGHTHAELIWFRNDYDNLVGTVTASTGGSGMIGDQFDGGRARVDGLELILGTSIPRIGGTGIELPIDASYTFTNQAEFLTSFDSDYAPWGDVTAGDTLPYIPRHQLQFVTGLIGTRWAASLSTTYVDESRTETGSGPIPPNSGTDAFTVVDLAASYAVTRRLDLLLRIDNLLDEVYNVARRPAGNRPGKSRAVMLGLHIEL